jgi:hypothetical protein
MSRDLGRKTEVRTGAASNHGRKADPVAHTGEVGGFPRLNQHPHGRGHDVQEVDGSHGDGRGVSASPFVLSVCPRKA